MSLFTILLLNIARHSITTLWLTTDHIEDKDPIRLKWTGKIPITQ
jgi:hypothetical protein